MACDEIFEILGGNRECYSNSTAALENGKKFALNNRNGKSICKVRVDNCLIIDNAIRKCDFLFYIKEDKKVFLVELKGQSVDDALFQIKSTFDIVNQRLKAAPSQYVGVVVSSAVPKAADQKFKILQQKLYRDHKLMVTRKQIKYEQVV